MMQLNEDFKPLLSERFLLTTNIQWRNVVGLAKMAPLGDENAPLIGAPGVRAYWDQFLKNRRKI